MALGARRTAVIGGVLRDAFRLALAGGVCGMIGALALAGALRAFVWGIEPIDPVTYLAVFAVLALATLAAAWIPARRAAAVDPAVTLRDY
jgi:ABC-type antimicrobial peptide transport system permease subunit